MTQVGKLGLQWIRRISFSPCVSSRLPVSWLSLFFCFFDFAVSLPFIIYVYITYVCICTRGCVSVAVRVYESDLVTLFICLFICLLRVVCVCVFFFDILEELSQYYVHDAE